ncbi:N,N-dimethylformamidase beta subunit family domain-containing protein [Krasilnikovia sp. MM14-A1004]|uniref:N,N-dimethylformamidase beta subunit family domain-containing protein n=1 Tax=Krasilnikovia sp. MM14-A1004 TaxID=3373541 RepID=UPI00399D4128
MRVRARVALTAVVSVLVGLSGFGAATTASAATAAPVKCAARPTAAGYVKTENRRPGATGWQYNARAVTHVEAFADTTSARCGQTVRLMVSTRAPRATVTAWRMGYYGGAGGRAVYTSGWFATKAQPAAVVAPATRSPRAPWKPSVSIRLDGRFTPGSYLLKISDSRGGQTFVPLTVNDPASTSPLVLVSEPLTWTAYNSWGGSSAYKGAKITYADRSLVASLDRPYKSNHGMATYLTDEYPLIRLAEQRGLDVAYVTDVDVHRWPALLLAHRGVLLGAHAEYWSARMRAGFDAARDAGVNLAVFGANTAYWQVRPMSSSFGADRAFAIYREPELDPVTAGDPESSTTRFRDLPAAQPESTLLGEQYTGCPGRHGDMVLTTPDWPFPPNTTPGTVLPMGVRQEFDKVIPDAVPANADLQVMASSPVYGCYDNNSTYEANVSYYTAPSGAGVFAAGTLGWVCHLYSSTCLYGGATDALTRSVFTATTITLITEMAQGPLGLTHPSHASAAAMSSSMPGTGRVMIAGDAGEGDGDDSPPPARFDGEGAGTPVSWLPSEVTVGGIWPGLPDGAVPTDG